MLQKCACSIPDILWLLSPFAGFAEIGVKFRESRNAACPQISNSERWRRWAGNLECARERGLSRSPSSSLACKLFGMGKSSFSSLSTPFRSQSGLNSQGQGRHFGVLTRQRVTGLLPPSDSRGGDRRAIFWLGICLISRNSCYFDDSSAPAICGKFRMLSKISLTASISPSNSPPFSFLRNGG